MGLLELLQQGQTILSAGSFPGDTPINDPQSGFVQSTSPTNTYSDETVGQPDNGSVLATTLNDTALDNTNNSSTTSTGVPSPNTYFPANAKGRYGLAPYVFNPNYNPSYTYLSLAGPDFTWHNNNELKKTSLDNTNSNKISATPIPNDLTSPNYYPSMEDVNLGSFNGAPSTDPTYSTPYNIDNTYLNNVSITDPNSPQIGTLDQTGLDNTDNDNEFTAVVPDSITYPNNYPTITDVYLGEFRGAPAPYETIYNPDNTYLTDVPIQTSNSPQIPTLDQSSLDNANTGNINNTTNPVPNANTFPNNWPTVSPQTGMGKFGLQPNQYYTIWASNNKYYSQNNYNNIITNSNNPLIDYMDLTGLTLDPNSFASFIQTYPFNQTYLGFPGFPPFVTGQFNGAPSIFHGTYDGGNIYLNNVPIKTPNSPQLNTLDETGLDNTNLNANLTSFTPNNNTAPNNYPTIGDVNLGPLNGAPNGYQSLYNSNNTYLSSVSDNVNSIEENILGRTGLDIGNMSAVPTAIIPNSLTYPNIYPSLVSGEFNGTPSQYETPYNSVNTYLNNVPIQNITSPQLNTLDQSGLDNTGSNAPTTIVPDSLTYPNDYPAIGGVNLGPFNSAPLQYQTVFTPTFTYLDTVPIDSDNSRQKGTVLGGETGLDNTSPLSYPTSPPPSSMTSPTIYPSIPHANLGEFNGAPSQYQTTYTPNSTYLDQYSAIVNETNPQIDSLQRTGMDIQDPEDAAHEITAILPPVPDTVTVYPANVTSNTVNNVGDAPHQFNQVWRPLNRYYDDYIKRLKNRSLV
jgi:hypothetical protein